MIEDFKFGYVISEDSLCNILEKENIEDEHYSDNEDKSEYNYGEEDEKEFEEKCL
jgi:hypothetical protein